jgi:hypothetical protein
MPFRKNYCNSCKLITTLPRLTGRGAAKLKFEVENNFALMLLV